MTDLDLEDRLRSRLHDAVDDLLPVAHRLDAVARSAGGRTRRRRQWAVGAAAALATTVVLAVALPLTSGGGSRAVDTPAAAEPTTREGAASATFPGTIPLASVSSRQVLRALRATLPADVTITRAELRLPAEEVSPGDSRRIDGGVRVDLARGDSTRGGLEVRVHRVQDQPLSQADPEVAAGTGCPAVGYDPAPVSCTVITTADGRFGRATETRDDDFVIREVLLSTAGGGLVHVAEANSVDRKWGCSAPEGDCYDAFAGQPPPLTLDELQAIAEAPVWDTMARTPA